MGSKVEKFKYRLDNPRYTIYHRAALGGLAATVRAWDKERRQRNPNLLPEFDWSLDARSLTIRWDDSLSDREAVERLLGESFRLKDGLIDLAGLAIPHARDDLRAAVHLGLCGTFLQHNKMRPGDNQMHRVPLPQREDGLQEFVTYKGVREYAHQKAQGTKLLDREQLPDTAVIPQSLVPGAVKGASELTAPADEVFLLLYLAVSCTVYFLRPFDPKEKAQYAIVIPDIEDLEAFVDELHDSHSAPSEHQLDVYHHASYFGRIVAGGEEAALRYLLDHEMYMKQRARSAVNGCLVVVMGKVAWDKQQICRSSVRIIPKEFRWKSIFRVAYSTKSLCNLVSYQVKKKGGESDETVFYPRTPIPALIARNAAEDRHWLSGFAALVHESLMYRRLSDSQVRKGLIEVKRAITDRIDSQIIDAFQEAWRFRMKQLYDRAAKEELIPDRLLERARERYRFQILRLRTSEALANWFMQFCTAATKGGRLKSLSRELCEFMFDQRNFERFQSLLLFAMLTYEPKGEEQK